jgi:hypothetical protein
LPRDEERGKDVFPGYQAGDEQRKQTHQKEEYNMRRQKMKFQVTAIGLACAALLSACGGGGGGDAGGAVQSISFPFPGGPTVALPSNPAPQVTLKATASSGGPVTYTSNTPEFCSVNASTLSLLKAGECAVTATQAGFEGYAATSERVLFVIPKNPQQITLFRNPGAQAVDATPVLLSASSTSGRPVTFSSKTPAVCSVSGNTMTKLADGLCTVEAMQDGGEYYQVATMNRDIPLGTENAPELTFLSGYRNVDTTKELGTIGHQGNQWWCNSCDRSVASDGSSFSFTAISNGPPADWWTSLARFWIHAPGLTIAASEQMKLEKTGNTINGVRIDAQAALKFNLAQNPEWFGTGKNGVNVELILGHFNLKNGTDACNVRLKATFMPTAAAGTNYRLGLKDQFTISEACGLTELDLWTELQDHPISVIQFSAVKANAGMASASTKYETKFTLTGPVTFQ